MPTPAPDMLAEPAPAGKDATASPRLGLQLGEEVVRLMFDNLAQDRRLLPEFKRQLREIEPAVLKLTQEDSRFFSDRTHPARQFLDRITQRSLAFADEKDPGWQRFLVTVEDSVRWLGSKVVDADTFGELLDNLQDTWVDHDQVLRHRREEAARALLHAEQRNLLAQKLAAEFTQATEGLEVADFVVDFLRNSWAQVVAEAQLSCADGSSDPYGYRALVDDLVWSVQRSTATRGRAKRLVQMIPNLLTKLREGLDRIEYPPDLTARFFNNLITIHRAAVHEGRDVVSQAAAEAAETQESEFSDSMQEAAAIWLDSREATESGYVPTRRSRPSMSRAPKPPSRKRRRCRRRCAPVSWPPAHGWRSSSTTNGCAHSSPRPVPTRRCSCSRRWRARRTRCRAAPWTGCARRGWSRWWPSATWWTRRSTRWPRPR